MGVWRGLARGMEVKAENKGHTVWAVCWEETERGWGTRPDGYFLYKTPEEAVEDTVKREKAMREREKAIYDGEVPDSYSRPTNGQEPLAVRVGPLTYAKVQAATATQAVTGGPSDAIPYDGALP